MGFAPLAGIIGRPPGATLLEEAGYVALAPGWPDDPETVEEAREHPEVFVHKGVGEVDLRGLAHLGA